MLRWLTVLMLVCAAGGAGAAGFPQTPEAVEAWSAAREAREAGVRPDTRSAVQWAAGSPSRTPLALVYLHGYSATRQEVSPLTEELARALGANLYLTRLRGHGRDGEAMREATAEALREDAEEALAIGKLIGDRVVLVSTSTGGTLSTWLAAEHPDPALAALVMISPNFAARDRALYVLDWPVVGPLLLAWFGNDYRTWTPWNEAQARYWTWSYPYAVLPELVRLMREVERIDKARITVPALMIYSPKDKVVDTQAIETVYAQWGAGAKRLVPFEGSGDPSQHVLAGNALSPGSTATVEGLVRDFLGSIGIR
ncbi:MAG: alpha/beta hydrolase [Gammaproteobacteria bacterium]